MAYDNNNPRADLAGGAIVLLLLLILAGGGCWGYPQYRVYSMRLSGEADLARADSTKRVMVTQAQAEKDAALLRADAIKIVGQAAKEFPEYRQQEFIGAFANALEHGNISQIIYVPTEGAIPKLVQQAPPAAP